MSKEERIEQLKQEIERFDYRRLKSQEQIQQIQIDLQQKLTLINQGIFTRQGEIVGLKRLMEEEKEKDGSSTS